MCNEKMAVSSQQGKVNHFYCLDCKQVYLITDIDWSKQVVTKTTMLYAKSDNIMIHIYHCFMKGYSIDIQYKDFNTTLSIEKEQAESLIKQLERKNR